MSDRVSKILIIQTAFIGDVILTTPLIQAVRQRFPSSVIDILVIPAAVNVIENNPAIRTILIYDKKRKGRRIHGLYRIMLTLRREKYDLVLCPHRSFRSALLARCSKAAQRIAFRRSAGACLFTHRVPYRSDRHEVERNLSLLDPFGHQPHEPKPVIYPDDADRAIIARLVEKQDSVQRFLAIAPGSVWKTKRWPLEHFQELIRLLPDHLGVFLIGGKEDVVLCHAIAQIAPERMVNTAGQLTLRQSAELIRRCTMLLSNDSAPTHLASAMGVPTIVIFGPTVPAFGFGPLAPRSRVMEKELPCRPCSIHGGIKCPIGTHECMVSITPESVCRFINEQLEMEPSHECIKN